MRFGEDGRYVKEEFPGRKKGEIQKISVRIKQTMQDGQVSRKLRHGLMQYDKGTWSSVMVVKRQDEPQGELSLYRECYINEFEYWNFYFMNIRKPLIVLKEDNV